MEELGVSYIDSLVIAFPISLFNASELSKDSILPLWRVVQQNLKDKVIRGAGVSDFNKHFLEQLCGCIDHVEFLPQLDQVNLQSCCRMPEDLIDFAKEKNIQLTTHNDPRRN